MLLPFSFVAIRVRDAGPIPRALGAQVVDIAPIRFALKAIVFGQTENGRASAAANAALPFHGFAFKRAALPQKFLVRTFV